MISFFDVYGYCMDNPTVKLLTNYHTTANMSPLPILKFSERQRKKKKEKSLGHIHLNSQVAIQKMQIKRERKIKFIGPNPPLLIFITTVDTNAKDLERKTSPFGLWNYQNYLHWQLVGGKPTFITIIRLHFNARKGLHPQVIAVNLTASILPHKMFSVQLCDGQTQPQSHFVFAQVKLKEGSTASLGVWPHEG